MILNHFVVTSECKINVKANVNTIYIYIYIYIYILLNSGSKNEKKYEKSLEVCLPMCKVWFIISTS